MVSERRLKRTDLRKATCLGRRSPFGKPDLYRVNLNGETVIVKDVSSKPFLFRWTLGLWLIHKEWKIYRRLAGVRGVPRPVARIDPFAFAMEFVPGRAIERGERLPASFFQALEQILKAIHSAGIVHLDLRHKGNLLISETGEPWLIDFNSSFSFRAQGLFRRFLFPLLQQIDYGGLLKLKQRVSPSLMTRQEIAYLRRFNWLRRLWIFN